MTVPGLFLALPFVEDLKTAQNAFDAKEAVEDALDILVVLVPDQAFGCFFSAVVVDSVNVGGVIVDGLTFAEVEHHLPDEISLLLELLLDGLSLQLNLLCLSIGILLLFLESSSSHFGYV